MHKIDDDIFLSCAVVVDIDSDDVENIVFGSTNGTIKAVNVSDVLTGSYSFQLDGTPCFIQPLTSKGRLSAMCVNDRGVFACSVDGQLLSISCRE